MFSPKTIILAVLGLSIFGQVPNWVGSNQSSRPAREKIQQIRREERDRMRSLRAKSRIALDRYRAGCLTVNSEEGSLLQGNVLVVTGRGKPLQDGTVVCNGITTAISIGGTAQNIARVGLEDRAELAKITKLLEEVSSSDD